MTMVALDANAIHAFQEERINDNPSDGHAAVQRIFDEGCIALDDADACLQEWTDTAGGQVPFALTDWVNDQLAMGTIKTVPVSGNYYRQLIALGLPKKDHKWVKLAISCGGKTIVTNDIDFFDPALKSASEAKKVKAKEKGGACSKALAKNFGVGVKCMVRFAKGEC